MSVVHFNGNEIVCTNGHHLTVDTHNDDNFLSLFEVSFSLTLGKSDLKNLDLFVKNTKKISGDLEMETVLDLDKGIITFSFENNALILKISPYQFPSYQQVIPSKERIKEVIGFNRKYLIALLQNMEGENVKLSITNNLSPCLIQSTNTEVTDFGILMPVKV